MKSIFLSGAFGAGLIPWDGHRLSLLHHVCPASPTISVENGAACKLSGIACTMLLTVVAEQSSLQNLLEGFTIYRIRKATLVSLGLCL